MFEVLFSLEFYILNISMLPCPTTGPSKEKNVNEDICGGDDDNDEGADANVVRHPVQHALVVVMMYVDDDIGEEEEED